MDPNWLLRLDKGLPNEDLVIILIVNPTTSSKRADVQDAFESDARLAAAAHRNYTKYAKQFKWKILDGSKSKDHVHQEVMRIVRKELKV
jgi:Thymidylate kinase